MHGCIGHDRPPGPLAAFQEGALRARRGISGIVARETPPSLARKPPSRGNQNRRCNPPVPATKGVPIPHSCWAGCSSQAILTEARSATRHRIYICIAEFPPYPKKYKYVNVGLRLRGGPRVRPRGLLQLRGGAQRRLTAARPRSRCVCTDAHQIRGHVGRGQASRSGSLHVSRGQTLRSEGGAAISA